MELDLNRNRALFFFLNKLYKGDHSTRSFSKTELFKLLDFFNLKQSELIDIFADTTDTLAGTYAYEDDKFKEMIIPLFIQNVIKYKAIAEYNLNKITTKSHIRLSRSNKPSKFTPKPDILDFFIIENYKKFINTYTLQDDLWPYVNIPLINVPDLKTLGVVINLHGSIQHNPPQLTTHQPDVVIQKYNMSGYGSVCYSGDMNDDEVKILAKHTLTQHQFTNCINRDIYIDHTKHLILKYPQLYHPDISCQLAVKTKFYDKIFQPEIKRNLNHLIFIRYDGTKYVDINLLTCSQNELFRFFYGNVIKQIMNKIDELHQRKKTKLSDLIPNFINEREFNLTTSKIFDFITLAKERFNIDKANIIDLSCSPIPASHSDESFHGYKTTPGLIGDDVSHGGKRTRRTRKNRKKLI